MKKYIIIATGYNLIGKTGEVFTKYEDGELKFLRYKPYSGAVKDYDGKPARYTKDEADRFEIGEARRILIEEMLRRGEEPEKHFWVRELRIIEE